MCGELSLNYFSPEEAVSYWITYSFAIILICGIICLPIHVISFWLKEQPLQTTLLRSIYMGIEKRPKFWVAIHMFLFFAYRIAFSIVIIYIRGFNFYFRMSMFLVFIIASLAYHYYFKPFVYLLENLLQSLNDIVLIVTVIFLMIF